MENCKRFGRSHYLSSTGMICRMNYAEPTKILACSKHNCQKHIRRTIVMALDTAEKYLSYWMETEGMYRDLWLNWLRLRPNCVARKKERMVCVRRMLVLAPEVFFFNLHSGGWSPNWVHSARRPLTGLLYLPRVIMRMENLVEWMAGEPKYSEKTCPDATLSTTNPTWPDPGLNPGRHGGKPATNCFSYGAAQHQSYT
jgi:hypothetical protein